MSINHRCAQHRGDPRMHCSLKIHPRWETTWESVCCLGPGWHKWLINLNPSSFWWTKILKSQELIFQSMGFSTDVWNVTDYYFKYVYHPMTFKWSIFSQNPYNSFVCFRSFCMLGICAYVCIYSVLLDGMHMYRIKFIVFADLYTCMCICVCINVCMYMCMYVYIYIYIYIYIYV